MNGDSGLWCKSEQDLIYYEAIYGEPPEWVQEYEREQKQRLEALKSQEEKDIEADLDKLIGDYISANEEKIIQLAAKKYKNSHQQHYYQEIKFSSPLREWNFKSIPVIDSVRASVLNEQYKRKNPGYGTHPDTPRCVQKKVCDKMSQSCIYTIFSNEEVTG